MSDPLPLGPLPDCGPPLGQQQDGSQPGMVFSSGQWVRSADGTSFVNVPTPSGSAGWFPPSDGHPMEH